MDFYTKSALTHHRQSQWCHALGETILDKSCACPADCCPPVAGRRWLLNFLPTGEKMLIDSRIFSKTTAAGFPAAVTVKLA